MQQDSSSFWTEIRDYEAQLAKKPDSFCFAKLSEIYRAVGLLDDALQTAQQGVDRHPAYLAGLRALALACYAKGLNGECQTALQQVTAAFPEDAQAQKLLGRLCAEQGNLSVARQAYRTALEFVPDDVECRMELEALERSGSFELSEPAPESDDEEILENLEIVEDEDDFGDEDQDETGVYVPESSVATIPVSVTVTHTSDPLSTVTLAELYVTQGFTHKALEIFRSILSADPGNSLIRARIAALELQDLVAAPPPVEDGDSNTEQVCPPFLKDDRSADVAEQTAFQEPSLPAVDGLTDLVVAAVPDTVRTSAYMDGPQLPVTGRADNALSELELWLENIRRFKSCRSGIR